MNREEVLKIQNQLKNSYDRGSRIALKVSGASNTTRSKSYNKNGIRLDLRSLNRILHVDPEKQIVIAEPRVTMKELVSETLKYGFFPPVVPEFKGITVGGAIMGCAAESGSHKWGIFSDICMRYHLLCGNGDLIYASPSENADVYHAIPGSYGCFGILVAAEIRLIPSFKSVHIKCSRSEIPFAPSQSDFVDGILFHKNHTILIEANLTDEKATTDCWYFENAKKEGEEILPLENYLFRYDQGAFWMGAYLLNLSFLFRFVKNGLLKFPSSPCLTQSEIQKMSKRPSPHPFWLKLMPSQNLWKLHHMAEKWVHDRLMIQDCCMPLSGAKPFSEILMQDPGIFPLWLCPIKNPTAPQLFASHNLSEPVFNFGLYGLPSYSAPMELITRKLEKLTVNFKGRKVLYSRSYYTHEEFWEIYPRDQYEKVRHKTHAESIFPEITEKVLSE